MGELIKPKSCDTCPAVESNKTKIMCGCLRELSANKNDFNGKEKMYRACPLGWAKGGGKC